MTKDEIFRNFEEKLSQDERFNGYETFCKDKDYMAIKMPDGVTSVISVPDDMVENFNHEEEYSLYLDACFGAINEFRESGKMPKTTCTSEVK